MTGLVTLGTLATLAAACGGRAARRGRTVVFASGADLQTVNPLLTVHPFAKQVERYVLLTTLARYDSALVPQPYLARAWTWSADRKSLVFRLQAGVRWHDGTPTTARDVAWTLSAARDPATGYPRTADFADVAFVNDPNDSTVVIRFAHAQRSIPDVLTDLAILPAHVLDSIPRAGPPALARLIIVVVDEPTAKLAALTAGEIDFAGIQPAHVAFVRKDTSLAVIDYPLIFPYGIVFNMRRPPFDDARVRLAVALALDRREIVDGYLYGFGTVADGPVPPGVPGYAPVRPIPANPDSARRLLGGRHIAFELLTVGSGEGALEQMIQARLAAVGFDVAIRQLELTAFLARVNSRQRDFTAAVLGTPGDPGLGYLQTLAALAGVRPAPDPATAQRVFRDSLRVALLHHVRGLRGMNRRVSGVRMDVRGELPTIAGWRTEP